MIDGDFGYLAKTLGTRDMNMDRVRRMITV
jgi:hypothetical protein